MSKSHALLTKPSTPPHEAWQSYSSVTPLCSLQTEPLFIRPRQLLVRQKVNIGGLVHLNKGPAHLSAARVKKGKKMGRSHRKEKRKQKHTGR